MHRLPPLIALVPLLVLAASTPALSQDPTFHVAPAGDDGNDGSAKRPFRSIERGLAATRAARSESRTLVLAGGIYELAKPIVLDKRDEGLVIRGEPGARLLGGRIVRGFAPVRDRAVLDRLPEAARDRVLVTDLRAQGITDYGTHKAIGMKRRGTAALELFVDGRPRTLARYPNAGWLTLGDVPDGRRSATFNADVGAERLARWSREAEPWLYGYWYRGWADSFLPVKAIDPAKRTITLAETHHYGMRKGQRFLARNLLCELDAPGEYFVDRASGMLYLWPADGPPREAIVSQLETPVIRISGAHRAHITGLTVEAGRGSGIEIVEAREAKVLRCLIRNLGEYGVEVRGGRRCVVFRCTIHDTGAGGVAVEGGDRRTLFPGNHLVQSCRIHHVSRLRRTYTAAVSLRGVCHEVSYNLIHHAPHQAISFHGNDHSICSNEIHHVVLETDDAGAIYTCPRDLTSRGTYIGQNHLHHCGPHHAPRTPKGEKSLRHDPVHRHGTSLIYLDDLAGGMTVEGNILEGAHRAILVGGGRDNKIRGNLILGGNIGIWIDARGLGWAKKKAAKGGSYRLWEKYAVMVDGRYTYPQAYPELENALNDHPAAPVHTVAEGNIVLGAKHWKKTDGRSDPFVRFERNHHGPRPDLPPGATAAQWLESVDPSLRRKIEFHAPRFDRIGPPETPASSTAR